MGLFSKDTNETCPICGKPTKGIFNFKISDGSKICKDCFLLASIDAPLLLHQSLDDVKDRISYRQSALALLDQFNASRELRLGNGYLRDDPTMHKWYYIPSSSAKPQSVYDYSEVVDYELTEDGDQITKGGVGAAVAGGFLFGGVGAIVGSNVGKKKTRNIVSSMQLRVSLNNKYDSQVVIDFVPPHSTIKSDSREYKKYKQQAADAVSFFDNICSRADISHPAPATTVQTPLSGADEIAKYKKLLDDGIITPEEFEKKKSDLLGL